jgi:hypothetical protein
MKSKTIEQIDKEISDLYSERKKIQEEKEKERKIKEKRSRIPLEKLKDYSVVDSSNVWGIMPFIKKYQEFPEEFKLEKDTYCLFENKDKIASLGFKEGETITFSKTKFSREYIEKAVEIAKILGKEDYPKFFLQSKNGEIIEHQAMIMTIRDMCFMFAPRVENE